MFHRVKLLSALLLFCLLMSGCNGARETDAVAYVLAVGVDAAADNQLSVTYLIAIPRALGSGGESGGGEKVVEKVTVKAPSLVEAQTLLNASVGRAPNLSHVKIWVVGEKLARQGLANLIGPLTRFREFRGSMYLVVARGTAKEFIDMNNPELELLPSRWAEGVLGISSESGYYLSSQLHDFYVRLKEPGGAPCTVLAGINPDTGKDKPSAAPTLPDRTPGYLPGDIAREGGNPAALAGTAVFKGDKMIGMLTNVETRMLAILMGNFPKGFLTLADPRVPDQNVYLLMRLGSAPKIDVSLIDDVPEINIEVLIECELSSISSGTNYEADELRPEIEQQVSKAISLEMKNMLVKTQELEADVVNFGKYLRPKVRNYDEFSAIDWNRLYPQAQIHIKVDAKLRRTGLMYKTMPIRE